MYFSRPEGFGKTSRSGFRAKDEEGAINQYVVTVIFDKTL
jgi:hypothetical protein